MNKKWSQEEEDLLKKIYFSHTAKELCNIIKNKTYYQIKNKAQRMKLKKKRNINKNIIKYPSWTSKEINFVIENTKKRKSAKEIGKLLGRTEFAVRKIINTKKIVNNRFWTDQEVCLLKEYYPSCRRDRLEELIPTKTKQQIISKAKKLKLRKQDKYKSGELEKIIIKRWKEDISRKQLSKELGISIGTLYKKSKELGLKKDIRFSKNARSKRWSGQDIEFIKKNYKNKTYKQMASFLGRTFASVLQKTHELGLEKEKKWTQDELNILILNKDLTNKQISKIIDRTERSIKNKFNEIKALRYRRSWKTEEIRFATKLFNKGLTNKRIAKILHRTPISVKTLKNKLGIIKDQSWTKEEINILRTKHYNTTLHNISRLLPNRTTRAIKTKLDFLGLPYALKMWTLQEMDILREKYSTHIPKELMKMFPDKTYRQIKNKAKVLGLEKSGEAYERALKNVKFPLDQSILRRNWRTKILNRDRFCCQLCRTIKENGELHAHHIKPTRDCSLKEKYDINNGICLCISCHFNTYNKEYEYYNYFTSIVGRQK